LRPLIGEQEEFAGIKGAGDDLTDGFLEEIVLASMKSAIQGHGGGVGFGSDIASPSAVAALGK
jgi:hypothetical protein